jgi:RsiW-degrading membrane proteinase PrsW (M82 family)
MPIRVRCSGCDKPLNVPDKFAGGRIRCPACDALLKVPVPADPGARSPDAKSGAPEKSPGKSPRKSDGPSSNTSSTAVPDEWLFGDETPGRGPPQSVDADEYGVSEASAAPPPRVVRKSKDSTFVAAVGSSDAALGGQRPRRAAAADNLSHVQSTAWRNQLYWILLLAIAPLAISIVWPGRPTAERFQETLQQIPEFAAQDPANAGAPQADVSVDDFFKTLPEHRIVGAHLARDSSVHWGYAALSATLFLALLMLMFPNDAAGPSRLIWTGIITGTIGILLLLGFQWVANFTQGFNLRGRGIVVLLFYIVKFIGYSYRAALDPENGFPLSFMGFTCGVGLCEELCKAFPIILFLRAKPHCGWRAACAVGLASGVGFGVSEGITYSADSYNGIAEGMIYLVRFASCVALHAIWAGSVALVINRNQDYVGGDGFDWGDAGNFILHYLAIAMVLHGLYDTLLKKDMEIAALAVAVASFAWLAWLVTRERREE